VRSGRCTASLSKVRHAVTLLARICDDPYDPVFSAPTGVPRRRVADVGDFGFIVFVVDEAAGLVRVFDLVWTG
jgi:hypothetical protein